MRELEAELSGRNRAVIADVDRLSVLSGRQHELCNYVDSEAVVVSVASISLG